MILLDTSGILAALFADQRHHAECARALREAEPPYLLSPFVLAEADYLIQKYGGAKAEMLFLEDVASGAYTLDTDATSDIGRALYFLEKYKDLNIGLADASLVVLAEMHDCAEILTLDRRHFSALRFRGRQRFRILPALTSVR